MKDGIWTKRGIFLDRVFLEKVLIGLGIILGIIFFDILIIFSATVKY
ncbi:hypothetical protein [Bacillus cereus]|nr:hypothetical protein [Bacillus cereus]